MCMSFKQGQKKYLHAGKKIMQKLHSNLHLNLRQMMYAVFFGMLKYFSVGSVIVFSSLKKIVPQISKQSQ